MKKGKILLSFALLCSPFWLTAAQNNGASQGQSAAASSPLKFRRCKARA
ncbi:hypothetical protein [uncultured Campylobacter sp.]|nr:hypothetical protein [uncultured Campylobacter sp.]